MNSDQTIGLFVDYEYVHNTLERTFQINPDPRQIIDAINVILSEYNEDVIIKKAYAIWDKYQGARQAFDENSFDTINTACATFPESETAVEVKSGSPINSLDLAICCDIMESINGSNNLKSYYLVLGDGRFEELLKRLKKKEREVFILGFGKNTPNNLKSGSNSFINLDDLIKRHHNKDFESVIETFISLSHKLPYVGYKYLMDILSRNDLHTDYRQLLNLAQEEGIIRLVEVGDPNTVRGKAFAIELENEHPAVVKHLTALGLATDIVAPPTSVRLRDDEEKASVGYPGSEDHDDSRFIAGKRLVEIGQHEAAITEFINYLEEFPNDFLGFVYVVNCLIKKGDRKQARVWCKRALNLPNTPITKRNIHAGSHT